MRVGLGCLADLRALANDVAREEELRRYTSTQENAWMLLAAAALIKDAERTSFEIEGAAVAGPLFKEYSQATLEAAPVAIKNLSTDTLDAVVNTTGVTVVPEPAGGNEWRTPPLWGIGLFEDVNDHTRYLHDGRARNLEEAVLWHAGEAEVSSAAFKALAQGEREALLRFLQSL